MKIGSRCLAAVTAAALAIAALAGCSGNGGPAGSSQPASSGPEEPLSSGTPGETGEMLGLALQAQQDLLHNFWRGDDQTGHIMKEDHGYETEGGQTMIWAHAMMLFGMETMLEATGDPAIRDRINAQWQFTRENFNEEQLSRAGTWPNIAVDDAGWDAMAYMLWYRITGDDYALRVAGRTIRNAYDYWKDGEVGNGLWYTRADSNEDNNATYKSLYSAALILAALEYCEATGDQELLDETLALYRWIEENLMRDGFKDYGDYTIDCADHLYFTDFNVNRPGRTERNGPDGGMRPMDIQEAGSVSFLGGNMAMGVIHARLYAMTGEESYLTRAIETVRAITDGPYNNGGVLLNDRDAWTTAAFAGLWAKEVLILPGVTDEDKELLYNTARSIAENARTPEGYYGGSWSGPAEGDGSAWCCAGSMPEQLMTSANSANILFAAALLEKREA